MKNLRKIIRYVFFLALGVFIFWWIYKDLDMTKLKAELPGINYWWIALSVFLGLLAQLSRAIRWKMLIDPLGYKPRLSNVFLSVLVLYCVNLILPRAGEVARCTVVSKYEKIPVTKLVGTMIVERLVDFIALVVLAIFVFAFNLGTFQRFFQLHPEINQNMVNLLSLSNLLLLAIIIGLLVVIFLLLRPRRSGKFFTKLGQIRNNFREGIKSVLSVRHKGFFIFHTVFIFTMWLLMLYVVFLAFKPTQHLNIWVGMFTFLMGGLGMLAPVQGGIGPWHFMIIESLFLFGICRTDGMIFALLAHTTTNLVNLVFGSIAFMLLPVFNRKE
jgi:glycosyltransferase 2 family protein